MCALRRNAMENVVSKVYRCAIHLPRFDFPITHKDGSRNAFPNILARCSNEYRNSTFEGNIVAYMRIWFSNQSRSCDKIRGFDERESKAQTSQ